MVARLKALVRRGRAQALYRLGMLRLIVAVARGRVDELWIGDSHAVLLTTSRFPFPVLAPASDTCWVLHLGPRVMYSIARNGFPPRMHRFARTIARLPGARRMTVLFTFGEIDIRCHLVPRLRDGGDLRFVATYVDHVRGVAAAFGTASPVVVVPVPPGEDTLDHVAFPVVGSLEERLAVHRAVRSELAAAASGDGTELPLRLIDLTGPLSDETGRLRPAYTDDGCHTNDAGRAVVRRELATFLSRGAESPG